MLMGITSRLVCFYEAAHANAASTQWSAAMVPSSSSSSSSTSASATSFASQSSSHSQQSLHSRHGTRQSSSITSSETSGDDDLRGYESAPPHMRLGNLTLQGSEAQLLGQVALTDACLDLIERLQEWKLAMDEKWGEGVHDEGINGCLDRLAKLTGLLQFGGMTGDVSCPKMPINKFSAKSLDGDVPDKPLIFVVEGRYQNWIKPIMLLECLGVDYDAACLDGPTTRTDWFTRIHPQRYVPALIDSENGQRVSSWDSSQILQYLASKYDIEKMWNGQNAAESLEIGNWLTFETASLGPTAKYWVWYAIRQPEEQNPKAQEKMYKDLRTQYGILDKHLSQPGQKWIGLKDRPTIADLAIYPFADDPTMERMGIDKHDFPALKAWSDELAKVPGVAKAYAELDSRKVIYIEA